MMDLISVVIPVYAVEDYLDTCLVSVVSQTYKELEIILVDDGSSDKSAAICDAWAEKDNRVIVLHQKNMGVSNARNKGLFFSEGKYISFVDSDDWIEDKFIETLYNLSQKENADISACNIYFVNENGDEALEDRNIPKIIRACTSKEAFSDIMNGRGIRAIPCNKLFKTEILNGITFPEDKKHEDEFFANRVIHVSNKLVYSDEKLYYYLQHKHSWMHTYSFGHLDALEAHLERIELFRKEYPDLYLADKVKLCIACANLYGLVIKGKIPKKTEAKRYIKRIRNTITVSPYEYNMLSIKDKIYVLATKESMIGIFSYMRNVRGMRP